MDQQEYRRLKESLDKVLLSLKDETLSDEEYERLVEQAAVLAHELSRPWFPMDQGRRLIVFVIVAFGLYGLAAQNYGLLVFWIILPFFSPRVVSEMASLLGKIVNFFSRKS